MTAPARATRRRQSEIGVVGAGGGGSGGGGSGGGGSGGTRPVAKRPLHTALYEPSL